jgi:hypothetical protein
MNPPRSLSDVCRWYWTSASPTIASEVALSLFLMDNYITLQDIDKSLNETAPDKIRKYRGDYNNNPSDDISFMTAIPSTSDRLHSEFIRILFLQDHRETDRFCATSRVQSAEFDRGYFHFRRAAFSSILKSKCGNILAKAAALRINLNLDGAPITSKSHTHPSYSQTSRLLTSSLSLGVPVPRPTQCV